MSDDADKKPKGKPRQVKNVVPLGDKEIAVYASQRVGKALAEITEDMSLFHGVRLQQILEAVYDQGQKDGARKTLEMLDGAIEEVKDEVPHRNPGQPRKRKKPSKPKK